MGDPQLIHLNLFVDIGENIISMLGMARKVLTCNSFVYWKRYSLYSFFAPLPLRLLIQRLSLICLSENMILERIIQQYKYK